jgi:hypothetical protein
MRISSLIMSVTTHPPSPHDCHDAPLLKSTWRIYPTRIAVVHMTVNTNSIAMMHDAPVAQYRDFQPQATHAVPGKQLGTRSQMML